MTKTRIALLAGIGVLVLGIISSIFSTSDPGQNSTEPTDPPIPSTAVEIMLQEPVAIVPSVDDLPAQNSIVTSQVVEATEEIIIPIEPSATPVTNPEPTSQPTLSNSNPPASPKFALTAVPAYSGSAYATINGNVPFFSDEDMTTTSFESYSELDKLGRCGTAYACVGQDIMPTTERGPIGMIRPSGWETIRYDDLIEDRYLYNRCHLLGYQLTGENANEQNLITGTRYMNIQGMLPFENQVASYVKNTNNHVLLRVTPVFDGANLLASGVLMEAKSVEDGGKGITFCVFTYNVQPGILIDYATGASERDSRDVPTSSTNGESLKSAPEQNTNSTKVEEPVAETPLPVAGQNNQPSDIEASYIGNKNTKKFHYPSCSSVSDMKEKNKVYFDGTREQIIDMGYSPCKRCSP